MTNNNPTDKWPVYCELCYAVVMRAPGIYSDEVECVQKDQTYRCENPQHESWVVNAAVLLRWMQRGKIRGLSR